MTEKPQKFAETTSQASVGGFRDDDALSDLLRAVHLRGVDVYRCAPPSPFEVLLADGERVLHIAETDGLTVHLTDSDESIALGAGDLILLARGDRHSLTAARESPRWVTGTFAVENDIAGPLLAVLPPAFVIRSGKVGQEWLPLSLQLMLAEIRSPRPGAQVMVSRILDLLFIHALRRWAESNHTSPGWLTAAMDPYLAPVLTAIHRSPERAWTVEELSGIARQSTSAFAQRFTRLLGQSPAAYVNQRRLEHSALLLRTTGQSVSKIGRDVGYTSDAAFSRAFSRHFGSPPLRWRKGDSGDE